MLTAGNWCFLSSPKRLEIPVSLRIYWDVYQVDLGSRNRSGRNSWGPLFPLQCRRQFCRCTLGASPIRVLDYFYRCNRDRWISRFWKEIRETWMELQTERSSITRTQEFPESDRVRRRVQTQLGRSILFTWVRDGPLNFISSHPFLHYSRAFVFACLRLSCHYEYSARVASARRHVPGAEALCLSCAWFSGRLAVP